MMGPVSLSLRSIDMTLKHGLGIAMPVALLAMAYSSSPSHLVHYFSSRRIGVSSCVIGSGFV